MQTLIRMIRLDLGLWFLRQALKMLPAGAPQLEGATRGLREQSEYEHYLAYCQLLKAESLPFPRWFEQWRWITGKVRGMA